MVLQALVTVLQELVTVLQVLVTAQLLLITVPLVLVTAQLLLITVLLALVMVPPLVANKHPSFLALVAMVIQLRHCHHWVVILLSVSMFEHSASEQ
jgi:hypothetical protein